MTDTTPVSSSSEDLPFVIVKPFASTIQKQHGPILFSQYILPGIGKALQQMDLPDDEYVLCVRYRKSPKVWGGGGDIQIFVTGGVERNDKNNKAAMWSELAEETGFIPTKYNRLKYVTDDVQYRRTSQYRRVERREKAADSILKHVSWYQCRASDLTFTGIQKVRSGSKKNKIEKVACIVHGTYDEMVNLLNTIPLLSATGNDNIDAIGCISIREVKKIIPRLIAHAQTNSSHVLVNLDLI